MVTARRIDQRTVDRDRGARVGYTNLGDVLRAENGRAGGAPGIADYAVQPANARGVRGWSGRLALSCRCCRQWRYVRRSNLRLRHDKRRSLDYNGWRPHADAMPERAMVLYGVDYGSLQIYDGQALRM